MKYFFLKILYRLLNKNPATMSMVQYWKTKDKIAARVLRTEGGHLVLEMKGEKYPIMSFPRGYVLYGGMSKLKHEIKNQVFNDSWWALEAGMSDEEVIKKAKDALFREPAALMYEMRYDMIPPEELCPAVKEIYGAFTKVGEKSKDPDKVFILRDMLTFILNEDDGYRFRVQDFAEYFAPQRWYMKLWGWLTGKTYLQLVAILLGRSFDIMVNCEVIDDMKERIRLLKRIVLLGLKDPTIGGLFEQLCKELDWKKIYLTEGDRWSFRGKYYRVDRRILEY